MSVRLRLDEDKQGATLVSSEGLELWHYNFEELVEFRDQVCDVWRLAHAARRTQQAKEDLI